MKRQNSERAGKPLKRGESRMTITMDSYMPTIITEKRMKIEDLCRSIKDRYNQNDITNLNHTSMQKIKISKAESDDQGPGGEQRPHPLCGAEDAAGN